MHNKLRGLYLWKKLPILHSKDIVKDTWWPYHLSIVSGESTMLSMDVYFALPGG